MVQVVSFTLPTVSAIPRVRTYHTKKPSRFVHALSARPLKVHGGRGWSKYADGTESVFFIFDVCCTRTLSYRSWRYPVSATPSNAPRMYQFPPLSVDDTAFPKRRAKTLIVGARNFIESKRYYMQKGRRTCLFHYFAYSIARLSRITFTLI